MVGATERCWGSFEPHAHLSAKNLSNALLCVVAILPSVAAAAYLYSRCDVEPTSTLSSWFSSPPDVCGDCLPEASAACVRATVACLANAESLEPSACALAMNAPVWLAHVLFFVNVSLGFWLVGLAQRSFWLIDPYWTIIPPLLGHLYHAHPRSEPSIRADVCLFLVWVWSARLTHSYFRREDYKFGQREDWRYTDLARSSPRHWWIVRRARTHAVEPPRDAVEMAPTPPQFLRGRSRTAADARGNLRATRRRPSAVHRHPMGATRHARRRCCHVRVATPPRPRVTPPTRRMSHRPRGRCGLLLAYVADTTLHAYVCADKARPPLLRTGVWRNSRHPNYVGEQLFWWALALYGLAAGAPAISVLWGAAFNSCVLASVTVMTEGKMLREWSSARRDLYREHQQSTSVWLPWPLGWRPARVLSGRG